MYGRYLYHPPVLRLENLKIEDFKVELQSRMMKEKSSFEN